MPNAQTQVDEDMLDNSFQDVPYPGNLGTSSGYSLGRQENHGGTTETPGIWASEHSSGIDEAIQNSSAPTQQQAQRISEASESLISRNLVEHDDPHQ
jgi:hypothetical protein